MDPFEKNINSYRHFVVQSILGNSDIHSQNPEAALDICKGYRCEALNEYQIRPISPYAQLAVFPRSTIETRGTPLDQTPTAYHAFSLRLGDYLLYRSRDIAISDIDLIVAATHCQVYPLLVTQENKLLGRKARMNNLEPNVLASSIIKQIAEDCYVNNLPMGIFQFSTDRVGNHTIQFFTDHQPVLPYLLLLNQRILQSIIEQNFN